MTLRHLSWMLLAGGVFSMGALPAAPVPAEEGDFIQQRSYVGGAGISTQILGDFQGNAFFQLAGGGDEFVFEPAVDRDFGFAIWVGHREGRYAAEVDYWYSKHKASMQNSPGNPDFESEAAYHSFNVDLKRYFLTRTPTQPYVSFGLSFPWLVVKDGSFDSSGQTTNATFKGLGFNLGGGVELYVHPSFSITAGVLQRWAGYDKIKTIGGEDRQVQNPSGGDGSEKGDGLNFLVGGTVNF